MELSNLSPKQVVAELLPSINIKSLAKESGWQKRRGKKLCPVGFVRALMAASWQSDGRLSQWAWQIALSGKETISLPGLHRRVNRQAVELVKRIWGEVLAGQMDNEFEPLISKRRLKGRVLLQDSTVIGLPPTLAGRYPGADNGRGNAYSSARLDVIYDLCCAGVLRLGLSSFRRNDQAASGDALEVCRSGDLLIRDLGYAVLGVWKSLIDKGVDIVSRYPHQDKLHLRHQDKPVKLLKLLSGRKVVDLKVEVGHQHHLPLRLIAFKLPEPVAAERRRKARQDRDRRTNHSKSYYRLLGWQILLTTLDSESWPPQEVCKLYGLRWRIEVFFKAAKSHLHLTRWHPRASDVAIELALQVRLLGLLIISRVYARCQFQFNQINLSLLKVTQWLCQQWQNLLTPRIDLETFIELLVYYSRYQKRKEPNFNQSLIKCLC